MAQILPNFIIIGAMRSGTTSLARYLGAHPQVFMAAKKEVHFFDFNFDRSLDWYARHFARAGGKTAVGEATPGYMYNERAIARMARLVPQARLIVVLRNPVDRAYSHYWLNRARGHEPLDFAAAIAVEPERLANPELALGRRGVYLEGSRYLKHLLRVCRYYPRSALHVVIFEDLRDEPRAVFAAVCRFLGVGESFLPPNLGRPINRFVAFRSLGLRNLGRRLPRPLRRVVDRLNVREASYPPLDSALRRALQEQFAGENAALAAWLSRDLSVWSESGA